MKKLTMIIICLFIAISPFMTFGSFSFADDDYPSIGGGGGGTWEPITDEESLVAAFKAFCKTRNFDITHEPSELKAIVKWDYEMMQGYAQMMNVDLTSLNAHIWYTYENNEVLKFFMDETALSILNGFYGAIINLEHLDQNDSKQIYNGKVFTDALGYKVFCLVLDANHSSQGGSIGTNNIISTGTYYLYEGLDLYNNYNNVPITFPLTNNQSYTNTPLRGTIQSGASQIGYFSGFTVWTFFYVNGGRYEYDIGYPTIIYYTNDNTYYFGIFCKAYYSGTLEIRRTDIVKIETPQVETAKIKYNTGDDPPSLERDKSMIITTNSTTINNYITNNDSHDTYNYSDDDNPPVSKPPKLPSTPEFPTGLTDPNGNPFNFTMPDIGIDWNLNLDFDNLPFPFSIPHDIIRFLTILDSEPEAPRYQMQFTIFNTPVNIDIDLSVFDNQMAVIRIIILVGYVIFLIISTRALFHIY